MKDKSLQGEVTSSTSCKTGLDMTVVYIKKEVLVLRPHFREVDST